VIDSLMRENADLFWFLCDRVNWYQRKYPYAFIGARVVKDI
jgi:hypothetical protein